MERPADDPVSRSHKPAKVVLVNGLWTPALVMGSIGRRLLLDGYEPCYFHYRGRDDFERNADSLARHVGQLGAHVHCVGHSLGGLLLLRALSALGGLPIGRTVFIASPVRGAESARRLARLPMGTWLLGRSARALSEGVEARWRRAEPLGLIVGTSQLGLGRLLGPLEGANDGVVREEETRVEGSAATLRVASSHTPMLFSRQVAAAIGRFLEGGRFGAP